MATAAEKQQKEKARLLTPVFRVSFPHLFKASAMPGAKPKFSVIALFPKNSDLTEVKDAIRCAKIAAYGPNKADWPDAIESPVVDGDSEKYADYEGYKGHWAIKFSTNEDNRPGVYDERVQPVTDPAVVYPGCYAKAFVFARVWEFGGKKGVHFILDHLQKWKDGQSFSGKKPGEQVFSPAPTGDDDLIASDSNEDDGDDF